MNEKNTPTPPLADAGDNAEDIAKAILEARNSMAEQRRDEHVQIAEYYGEPLAEQVRERTVGKIGDIIRGKGKQFIDGPGSTTQKKEAYTRYVDTWSDLARTADSAGSNASEESVRAEVEQFVGGVAAALGRKDPAITERYKEGAEQLFKTLKSAYSFDC